MTIAMVAIAVYAGAASASSSTVALVTGHVTDANCDPVPGAEVVLYDDLYNALGNATTNSTGGFNFTDLNTASGSFKVKATYRANGKTYESQLQNSNWTPVVNGTVTIDPADSRISVYPEPDTGFLWGVIYNASNKPVPGTIYVSGESGNLTFSTNNSGTPAFVKELKVGNYTVLALHTDASGSVKSKPVSVEVVPSRQQYDTPSLELVADQSVSAEELNLLTATPQASSLPTPSSTYVPVQPTATAASTPSALGSLLTPFLALLAVGSIILVAGRIETRK